VLVTEMLALPPVPGTAGRTWWDDGDRRTNVARDWAGCPVPACSPSACCESTADGELAHLGVSRRS
jgi:hypothetical protein